MTSACCECGNDDPTEGYTVCLDCLEALGHEGDRYARSDADSESAEGNAA